MDFNWFPYMSGWWIFPLLCFVFMGIMMLACGARCFRFGYRGQSYHGHDTAREILDRRYASGEIGKEQFETMRRDLNG